MGTLANGLAVVPTDQEPIRTRFTRSKGHETTYSTHFNVWAFRKFGPSDRVYLAW